MSGHNYITISAMALLLGLLMMMAGVSPTLIEATNEVTNVSSQMN